MADENQETPERPEWLEQRFESVDAQAQAYAESRKEMDRMRSQMEMERQQYSAALEAIETRAQQQPPAQQEIQSQGYDPMAAAYERAYAEGDVNAMLRIQTDFSTKNTVDAVGRLLDERLSALQKPVEANAAAMRNSQIMMAEEMVRRQIGSEKYQELYPRISELVQDHPNFLPAEASIEGYATAITDLAKLAEHDTLNSRIASLEAERAEKLQAQTVPGAGIRSAFTPDQQAAEWERIKNAPNDSYAAMRSRQ